MESWEALIYDKEDVGKAEPASSLGHYDDPMEAVVAIDEYRRQFPDRIIVKVAIELDLA